MKKLTLIAILSIAANAVSASCMGDAECMNLLEKFGKKGDSQFSEATKAWLAQCRKDKSESPCNEAKQNIRDELMCINVDDKECITDLKNTVKEFFGSEFSITFNKKKVLKIVKEK